MPIATCYKREGTMAFFYSRKGPWPYPKEIKGIDPANVIPGHKVEIDFDSGYMSDRGPNQYYQQDLRDHGLATGGPVAAPEAAEAPTHRTQGPADIRPDGLMASATGIAKSCIEKGYSVPEALMWGAYWAKLWGSVPADVANSVDVRVKNALEGIARESAGPGLSGEAPAHSTDEKEIPF